MSEYKEKIINLETGEETWRDFTPDEIAEVEKIQAKFKQEEILQAEAAAKKEAVKVKLAALGLDDDDLSALGL